MTLARMNDLLERARKNRIGCGAFNVGNMEMIIGVIKAAEEAKTPVIMQIAEGRLAHSPLELMGPMMVQAAKKAKVDIAVHLDHGRTLDVIGKALSFGFTSVMFDGSTLPLSYNVRETNKIMKLAAVYSADVEGELGVIGGKEDNDKNMEVKYTNPYDAYAFCKRTHVSALAVSIGNAHGEYRGVPALDFDMLHKIKSMIDTPLVLHGGSGISDEDFRRVIRYGICKINIATASFKALAESAEKYMSHTIKHDFCGLNEAMISGVYQNVLRHIKVFNDPYSYES